MKRFVFVGLFALAACQGMKSATAPSSPVPGPIVEAESIGIDVNWRRFSAGGALPNRDNLLQWITSHPRLRTLSDEDRVTYLNRAYEILHTRGELGPTLSPSQLAASGTWTLPEGVELSTSASALVFGTMPDGTKDRVIVEGSNSGTDHYLAILSNIYTSPPTVTQSHDDLGAPLAGWTAPSLAGGSHSSPFPFNGVLWLGDDSGNLHRFDPATGAELGSAMSLCNGACGANDAIWSAGFIDSDNNKLLYGVNKRIIEIDLNACTASTPSCSFSAFSVDTSSFASAPAI